MDQNMHFDNQKLKKIWGEGHCPFLDPLLPDSSPWGGTPPYCWRLHSQLQATEDLLIFNN